MNFAGRLQTLLFCAFFAGIPGFMLLQLYPAQVAALATSDRLKPVPATVTTANVQEKAETVTKGGETRQTTLYTEQVQFSYQVDGKSYVSDRWGVSHGWIGDKAEVQANVDKYKNGQAITVFVDPNNPGTAVIERHVEFPTFGIMLFLSFFIFIASELFCAIFLPQGYQTAQSQLYELLFDIPCVVWLLFCAGEFFIYFTHSSAPYSPAAYIALVIIGLATIVIVRARLVGHGVLPPLSGRPDRGGPVAVAQALPASGAPWGSRSSARDSMLQGSMTAEQLRLMQMSRSPIARVAPVIVFLLIFGNTAYRMFSIQHGVEQRNPERTTVSSTADAIRQLDEQDKKVEKDPQNPWAHKQRGLNYFDAEMYEKAIPDLTYTLSKNVDDETLWCRARCYLLTRQFDKALPDYEQLEKIAKKPYSHYIAQRGIGICDYHLGKYQPAVEAFTKALAISSVSESDRKELFHDRCLSYYKLGKQELADADRNARGNDVSKYWLMDDGPKNR